MLNRELVSQTVAPWSFSEQEITDFFAALSRVQPNAIRLRPGVDPDKLPFATSEVPWFPRGRFVTDSVRPGAQLEFACGEYYIQDAASMLAVALLDPQPGETICDLCASPGGKATGILESLGDSGWVLVNESVHSRLGMLAFNLARHGSTRFILSALDPTALAQRLPGRFDAVLVDAPCSGQTLVGRGKQTAAAFKERTVEHCAARQSRILDAAAGLVRPGGRIVYSTCTFAYPENEHQMESFLRRNSAWELDPIPPQLAALDDRNPWRKLGVRLWPHRHDCGGAFASRMRCLAASEEAPVRGRTPLICRDELPADVADWGSLPSASVWRNGQQFFAWPAANVPEDLVATGIGGPEVAFCKGTTWFPAYALAMRRDASWQPTSRTPLDDGRARKFLRGEVVTGDHHGWTLATWRERPLGWMKGDGRSLKNHLPKSGRFT